MWIPDVMFFNQLSGQHFNEHFPAPPSIHSTGQTVVLKPFRVELECRLEVLHFPFDKQVSVTFITNKVPFSPFFMVVGCIETKVFTVENLQPTPTECVIIINSCDAELKGWKIRALVA